MNSSHAPGASAARPGHTDPAPNGAPPQLWEMQSYDTPLSYARFVEFFLDQQTLPRSLLEAYRGYKATRGLPPDRIAAIRNVPGVWRNWAAGKNPKGVLIPGAATWAARAAARDRHLNVLSFQKEDELWHERRCQIREAEFAAGEKLMARAARMQEKMLFERIEEEVVTIDGQPVAQTIIYKPKNWRERDIAPMTKLGSELMRRSAEMSTKPESDWRKDLQLKFPDLDPDEVQQAIVNVFLDLLDKHKSAP